MTVIFFTVILFLAMLQIMTFSKALYGMLVPNVDIIETTIWKWKSDTDKQNLRSKIWYIFKK